MKRVLFLAYLFPPIANSGTQRPLKFVKYLSQYGWQPTVVTAAHADGHRVDEAMLADIPAGVAVERVPMLNEQVRDTILRCGRGTRLAARVAEAVSWRLRDRFRTPDLYALWRPGARRAGARLMRDGDFDAIYATGFPWTTAASRPRSVGGDRTPAGGRLSRSRGPARTCSAPNVRRPTRSARSNARSSSRRHRSSRVSTTMTKRMVAAYPELDRLEVRDHSQRL